MVHPSIWRQLRFADSTSPNVDVVSLTIAVSRRYVFRSLRKFSYARFFGIGGIAADTHTWHAEQPKQCKIQ